LTLLAISKKFFSCQFDLPLNEVSILLMTTNQFQARFFAGIE